jgi:hypothetical protein
MTDPRDTEPPSGPPTVPAPPPSVPDAVIPKGQAQEAVAVALQAVAEAFSHLEAISMAMARALDSGGR